MRNSNEQQSINAVTEAFATLNKEVIADNIQYQRFDMIVRGNINAKIEVKYRRLDLDKFKKYWTKEGFMFESSKYSALTNFNSMYVNYFNIDNKEILLGWNLSGTKNAILNHSTEKKNIMCPATTDFTNKVEVLKPCYLLKRRTTTLRMAKIDGKWYNLSMNDFNKYLETL